MKKLISYLSIFILPVFLQAQLIDNFDALPDSAYWGFEISDAADSTLSFVNVNYVTDPLYEGSGAMQLEWGTHNSEDWGGYAKIYHYSAPQDTSGGGNDDTTVVGTVDLEGTTWVIAPEAGALKVGPGMDDGSWWENSTADVTVRACFFDDEYVFNADGSFNNVLGDETWVEAWQGVESDGCGTPVYPHNGTNAATWEYNETDGTITLNGVGAFLGIPKAYTGGELTSPEDAPESITYDIYNTDESALTVTVSSGSGYWTFKLVPAESRTNQFAHDELYNKDTFSVFEMRPRDGHLWDWSAYDSLSFSYYNSIPSSLAGRAHLRLNLSDYAGVPDGYSGLGEYFYSFHYILDDEPGWNTVTLPLVNNYSDDGNGFNLTGWAGDNANGELDTDAIGGIHFEFSICAEGDGNCTGDGEDGDFSAGTIILDNLTLTGYGGIDLIIFNGMNTPPAWETFSWGGAQMFVTEGGGYTEGTNALTYVQEDVWSGGGFNMTPAVDFSTGGEWLSDSLMFWMHSEVDAPTLRLQFEDGDDKAGLNFTPESAGGWNHYKFALRDFIYFDGSTMFDTSAVTVFQVLGEGNGASGRTFHFDDMWTGNPEFDVIPPDAPENISAIPTNDYFNLVTWMDVDGESDGLYHVYASTSEITNLDDASVELVASNVLSGAQAATHYLYHPLTNTQISYYYAVVCVDPAGNESELGTSSTSITNTALGIPTISLDVPTNFVADGDMSEWWDSGIMPFEINPNTGNVFQSVDNEDDLSATVYLAIDDEYLYFAADVIDDSYYFGDGNWYEQDALQFFFGLYDSRGPRHSVLERGEEPDYIVYANETTLQLDNPSNVSIGSPDDAHFYFQGFNPDYASEGKISLDTLALFGEDERFYPQNGMKIPLDIYFHDNDNGELQGRVGFSRFANDQQWNNPREWAWTWIGNQSTVAGTDDNDVMVKEFALYPNYPNPFNPVTSIKFSLPEDQMVSLKVYNLAGQMVKALFEGKQIAGTHSVQWNAGASASGVYFYRLEAGDRFVTQKMILVK